jgi:hypothetical protein
VWSAALARTARRRRSGEEIDDVGSKTGAVRRYQRRVFFARKISRDDVMTAVGPGYDEIGAQTLLLTAKQQFRVGHLDVIGVSRIEWIIDASTP